MRIDIFSDCDYNTPVIASSLKLFFAEKCCRMSQGTRRYKKMFFMPAGFICCMAE
ncbi:hypothetical protein BRYFOR_07403 [Marvinbryantia formatexigens DSM 14469]|uniref:Uncharacterized protein n=1 Tax=Marvinbryantia formatexigens DSM 14469 TaxID=478749 RepID=C6LFK0_9FIRM|nr:hypothetical protein BRYFOR_07403 [Marvinbryantia formatexigens DSM 14469]